MKKLNKCVVENCIPTPSSCVEWNGGDIEFLGICDGDSLNDLLWEVINKLEEIAGEDLSAFDLDSLLEICNQKAPTEITILSILNVLKANQICLKDFIDNLSEQLSELFNDTAITVNLKCYQEFDNLGNPLAITRETLDQLIIDNLCNHKGRIETLEGKVTSLQSQIDNLDLTPEPSELSVATCVNANSLPTSTQLINTSEAFCDLQDATGDPADIASALANTPGDLNAEFGLISGWVLAPSNWAENYNNLLLEVENLRQRINNIEDTCCALDCDDVKLGFSAVYNEDMDGVIISFTAGAGTVIPAGFSDSGSTGTITDVDGNTVDFSLVIDNNSSTEIIIGGLNTTAPLDIDITARISTDGLTCQKCVHRRVAQGSCTYCQICNTGPSGEVIVVYEDNNAAQVFHSFDPTTTTTTTTTTVAP
jgi:hypothetical protein